MAVQTSAGLDWSRKESRKSTQKWRDDFQCGAGCTTADGRFAECDPDGIYPCCSPNNWCGNSADHCDCADCVDYRDTVRSLKSKEDEINVALNKAASQSSLYGPRYPAERAVDGNTGTNLFHRRECTHTNLEYQPWWKVDLGDTYVISHVTVINRGDCCGERLKDFMIRVGHNEDISKNEQCGDTYTDIPEDGAILDIQCTTPMSGRWVSVQLSGRRDYLSLCEVQVFSTSG
ncbi:fucolectin-like [Branchiostoma floridae x Branchiostoma belcheri]